MIDEIQLNDVVALLVDIPQRHLRRGDVGTVVHIYPPDPWAGLLVEFENGIQADFDDTKHILKLRSCPVPRKPTLQEWAGASRIFALVFTDVVNSTALTNTMGDEKWIDLLRKHFAQARRLMSKYDHHEIKIIGDSFMVIFRDALAAFDFALALERDTGDQRISVRIGIHVGSARIIDDDIFGNMVNYTKRVESVRSDGGITLSDVAKREIENEKAERHSSVTFQDMSAEFKGLPNKETVWLVMTMRDVYKAVGEAAGEALRQWLEPKLKPQNHQ